MRKFAALFLSVAMIASLVSCGGNNNTNETTKSTTENQTTTEAASTEANQPTSAANQSASTDGYELALVTDVGNIDDGSFNQGTWEGLIEFAEANNKTYSYYRPSEDSDEARMETMKTAIQNGAKVLVLPGYLFETVVYEMQDQYPDVQFLLIDGEPHSADYSVYSTSKNVYCILYKEEQAGYVAGYSIVKDGYTQLGFLGGMEIPAVQRYGYGFLQGVDAAAEELGVDVNVKYWYSQSFVANDEIMTKMSSWFTEGTEVVFACGGKIWLSANAAAEANSGKLIGVDVDQAKDSDLMVTSAMKYLGHSVVTALTDLYANNGVWPDAVAGQTSVFGAAEDMVGLPTAEGSWRFQTFTVDEYHTVMEGIKDGSITVSNDTAAAPATTKITVDFQN
ncbi:MAG: BMP family ABC transporter substrate-binding protein [Lachnospiraceae bacterium]|nr:BMP family ABC transporter substrate-binding protein [Lachnospiraceae bacterium]